MKDSSTYHPNIIKHPPRTTTKSFNKTRFEWTKQTLFNHHPTPYLQRYSRLNVDIKTKKSMENPKYYQATFINHTNYSIENPPYIFESCVKDTLTHILEPFRVYRSRTTQQYSSEWLYHVLGDNSQIMYKYLLQRVCILLY